MAISQINSNSLASGVPASANMPAGSVLQVVNYTLTTGGSSNSSTYQDTGLTATITPTKSTSKILILIDMTSVGKDTSASAYIQFNALRNGSSFLPVATWENIGAYNNPNTGNNFIGGTGLNYLDSPATTSALTYKVQAKSAQNNATVYWSYQSASTITLMEIAA
jgi:hypothetical protein